MSDIIAIEDKWQRAKVWPPNNRPDPDCAEARRCYGSDTTSRRSTTTKWDEMNATRPKGLLALFFRESRSTS